MQAYGRDGREDAKIPAAIHEAQDQVRYHRFREIQRGIEEGTLQIVDDEDEPLRPGATGVISRDRWEDIVAEAAEIETRYGDGELGPWDACEWGKINGKFSPLQWVRGEEWDAPALVE